MNSAERVSHALNDHPWLAGADACDAGVLLLLSPSGHAQLHRQGRQFLLEALQAYLAAKNLEPPRDWRLLDAAPVALDAANITRLVSAARPKMVTPSAEVERDGHWKLNLRLPLDLVHFDDHFRHAPVLPGVVQAHLALLLAAPRLHTSIHCREMEAVKFQRLLRPGDQLELSLRFGDEPGDERGKLHFAYHYDGAHCSSGRLRVARTHD